MSQSRAWTWRHLIIKSSLPATTRHVLLTISCFMNELGDGCYPTQKQLAEATGLSERAVREHLEVAATSGWIKRSEHGFRGQKWRNHEYKACWPDPQDVEKGAAPSSAPSKEAAEANDERCGTSVQKVRHQVPPTSPDTNPITSPTGAQERAGGEDRFNILWDLWPEKFRPDNREAARATFLKIPEARQEAALRASEPYCKAMKGRNRLPRMFAFLRSEYPEFVDAPEIDDDGDFVITSKREEWGAWLGNIRRRFGEPGVERVVRHGKLVTKARWPDGENRLSA
jgi:hypothetical protein